MKEYKYIQRMKLLTQEPKKETIDCIDFLISQ